MAAHRKVASAMAIHQTPPKGLEFARTSGLRRLDFKGWSDMRRPFRGLSRRRVPEQDSHAASSVHAAFNQQIVGT